MSDKDNWEVVNAITNDDIDLDKEREINTKSIDRSNDYLSDLKKALKIFKDYVGSASKSTINYSKDKINRLDIKIKLQKLYKELDDQYQLLGKKVFKNQDQNYQDNNETINTLLNSIKEYEKIIGSKGLTCPNCGNKISEDDEFCSNCGIKL